MVDSSTNRTTQMAAVICLAIAGFAKRAARDQQAAKAALADSLKALLAPLPEASHIVTDTADGAAITFVSDPEHALYFALRCGFVFDAMPANSVLRRSDLRLGIHLGSIPRVRDADGHPAVASDAIAAAQRIMNIAAPGEITVSRSFFATVSRLHMSYGALFETRADNHSSAQATYRLTLSGTALLAACDSLQDAAPGAPQTKWPDAKRLAEFADESPARAAPAPTAKRSTSSTAAIKQRNKVFAGIALTTLLGIGVVAWNLQSTDRAPVQVQPPEPAAARSLPPAPPAPAEPPPPTATPQEAPAPTPAPAPQQEIAVESKPQPGATPVDAPPKPVPPPAMVTPAKPPVKTAPRYAPDATAKSAPPAQAAAPVVAKGQEPAAPARRSNAARCQQLLQRAQIGDAMTPQEQSELANACR